MSNAYELSDSRGEWLTITDEESIDDAQESGRWIKTLTPIELDQ